MKKRVQLQYGGHVQGVGFRFTSQKVAERTGITGFVRNLSNGNVEIIGEGDRFHLEKFIKELAEHMRGYISDFHVDWTEPTGEFSSFDIRF